MSIKEQLMADLKTAMKEKDTVTKNAVTMIRAGILQVEKDNKTELDDDGVMDVISKQLKQRKDALGDFVRAGRDDLIDQTNKEIAILEKYLPSQLTAEELGDIVREAVERLGISEMKQMKELMADVLPKVKGRADGKAVSDAAKALLGK
ncbi:MAG: GatB/YqeY domain-containing protein [Eubacteriaceae bacterium]|nr:GatB/YqeY domain-containing protein [Eubacteriaceae bacterium]